MVGDVTFARTPYGLELRFREPHDRVAAVPRMPFRALHVDKLATSYQTLMASLTAPVRRATTPAWCC